MSTPGKPRSLKRQGSFKGAASVKRSRVDYSKSLQLKRRAILNVVRSNAEKKWLQTGYHDTTSLTNFISAGAGGSNLQLGVTGPIEGTTQSTRIGDRITYRSVLFNFTMDIPYQATSTSGQANHVCTGVIDIILDRQYNGTAPAFGDIYETTTSGTSVNHYGLMNMNPVYSERFWRLRSIPYNLSSSNFGLVEKVFIDCSSWPEKDKVAVYKANTDYVAQRNQLLVYVRSNGHTTGVQTIPLFAMSCLLKYTDI